MPCARAFVAVVVCVVWGAVGIRVHDPCRLNVMYGSAVYRLESLPVRDNSVDLKAELLRGLDVL